MKSASRGRRLIISLAVTGLVLAGTSACAPPETDGAGPGDCTEEGSYSLEDIQAEFGDAHAISQIVYEVPKCLDEEITLAFLNPGTSIPYFNSWHESMVAAADFYGVKFNDFDMQLKFDNIVNQYDQLMVREPQAVGALAPTMQALAEPTTRDGVIYLTLGGKVEGSQFVGLDETEAGMVGGTALGEEVERRLGESWSGETVVLVLLGEPTDPNLVDRLEAGRVGFTNVVDVSADDTILQGTDGCISDKARTVMLDILTANPDDKVAVLACNDTAGSAAFAAVLEANRGDDVAILSYGGDESGQDAMARDTTNAYYGMVNFNPYSQGWNWVAAAIGRVQGETFEPLKVDPTIITQDNLEEFAGK